MYFLDILFSCVGFSCDGIYIRMYFNQCSITIIHNGARNMTNIQWICIYIIIVAAAVDPEVPKAGYAYLLSTWGLVSKLLLV